jgi:hypothetical protein
MARIVSITYAITKQVRQFEPVRVEVTIENNDLTDTPQSMLEQARTICEEAVIQAVQRGPVI